MIEQHQFDGAKEAYKAVLANMSPRYRRLEGLERWVTGAQYDGLKSWWDDSVPLWERAPCIVYPVVQIATQSNVDLVLGEGRFPVFTSKPGEMEADEENGLGEEDSQQLDRFIVEHHKICRFRSHAREGFEAGQGCGSAVGVHGVRAGLPFADLIPAKWCTPKLGIHGETLELEIKYPYLEEHKKEDGKWALKAKLYRRKITESDDITYLPADAREDGIEPKWTVDKGRTIRHGLGFCPVVWYPFMKGCVPVNVIDGKAIHARVTDEIQAHDIAVSQRHRGALLSEPQPCEIGVSPGYNPTEIGETATVPTTEHGGPAGPDNRITGHFVVGPKVQPARKKGPGYVWQYTNPETKVQYLVYPGDALKAQDDNARDLRIKLQEALCIVFLDPDGIKFASTTSGKALEAIKQRQIDRCDQYRDDLRDGFLLPSVSMQLRIAQKLGKALKVPGIDKVMGLLAKFVDTDGVAWLAPSLQLKWGPYFRADVADQKAVVEMVRAALGGESELGGSKQALITLRVAIEKIKDIFGIENVDALIEELEREQAEREEHNLEKQGETLEQQHEIAAKHAVEGGAGAGGFGKSKGPAKGGGSGAAAAPKPKK